MTLEEKYKEILSKRQKPSINPEAIAFEFLDLFGCQEKEGEFVRSIFYVTKAQPHIEVAYNENFASIFFRGYLEFKTVDSVTIINPKLKEKMIAINGKVERIKEEERKKIIELLEPFCYIKDDERGLGVVLYLKREYDALFDT